MKLKKLIGVLAVAGLAMPGIASATNGYFAHGYGMKSKGMAGSGIAMPQDAMAAATNPAGMVWVGNRIDFGADVFKPVRGTTINSTAFPGPPGGFGTGEYSGNGDSIFLIPEFGYNMMFGQDASIGIVVYGNGGMNTSYEDLNARTTGFGFGVNAAIYGFGAPVAPACLLPAAFGGPADNTGTGAGGTTATCPVDTSNGVFGAGKVGVDLIQLFVAPTYAMKVTPDHSLGVSLNLVYQQFKADGLHNFVPFSAAGANLTNIGYDKSTGYGLKFGWTGKISSTVMMGATYQTETKMRKFDKYRGLFAEQGGFDIPETYGLGIAVKATPAVTIAADIQQINYSKVRSVANSIDNLILGVGGPLGANNGAGFGWQDMTVFKLGMDYQFDKNLVLRGGFSTNRQPIPSRETAFNVLAPGVIENHLTLGATWTLANKDEVTVGYMHGFKKTVSGVRTDAATPGTPLAAFGNGMDLRMHQDSIGIAYGWKMM